jgi:GNAT superfamily N-acetyltransferase
MDPVTIAECFRYAGIDGADADNAAYVASLEDAVDEALAVPAGRAVIWHRPASLAAVQKALGELPGETALGAGVYLGDGSPADWAALRSAGIRVFSWSPVAGSDDGAIRDCLAAASREGFWNHLRLPHATAEFTPLTAFAADNPNIVHSWQVGGTSKAFTAAPADHPLAAGYGDVAPLDGMPLWRCLGATGALLAAIARLGRDGVRRRRLNPVDGSHWDVGTDVTWKFLPPASIAHSDMDEICRMVSAGGSVTTRWVRHNLERAFLIAVATERGRIVGNSSLKHPRETYIRSVKARYGLDFSHHLERGYTSVRPEYRGMGIGTRLLEGLTRRAGDRKIFSIIAEDNIATQTIAIRNRTRKVATVFSEAMGKEIGFWMPEE